MHTYPADAIERLKETLTQRAFKDSTPKKFSGPMYEAYEVICQLQNESSAYRAKFQAYEDAVSCGELVRAPQSSSADISPAVAGPAKEAV